MHLERKNELATAMTAAEEAFQRTLSEEFDVDPAYYDLELTGYVLSSTDFLPLERIVFPPTFESERLGRKGDEE